jgi:hypothetical protein
MTQATMQRHYIHVYMCMQALMPHLQIREPSSSPGPTQARSPAPSLASHVRSTQKRCHRLPARALPGTAAAGPLMYVPPLHGPAAALAWPGWPTGQLQETAPLGCLLVPCSHRTHAGPVRRTRSPAAGDKVKQRTPSTSRHTTEDASIFIFLGTTPSSAFPSPRRCFSSAAASVRAKPNYPCLGCPRACVSKPHRKRWQARRLDHTLTSTTTPLEPSRSFPSPFTYLHPG